MSDALRNLYGDLPKRLRVMAFHLDRWQLDLTVLALSTADVLAASGTEPWIDCLTSRNWAFNEPCETSVDQAGICEAVWQSTAPTALVVARPSDRQAVPADVCGEMPWIVALTAAERLWESAPSRLLVEFWDRRASRPYTATARGRVPANDIEAEAFLLAKLLLRMLRVATPDELVWLSRDVG